MGRAVLAYYVPDHGQAGLDRQGPEAGEDIGIEEIVFHDPSRFSRL
jgi:hypothetical protein